MFLILIPDTVAGTDAAGEAVAMIGLIPYTIGVDVPWTTPPILSGLICIGPMGALWQLCEIVASFFIYLPFARSVDNEAYEAEQAAE